MRDRQANDAGRIKLVEEGTTEQRYFYMQMADNPVSGYEGTPLNKANLLSDSADEAVFNAVNESTHTVSRAFQELGSSRVRPYDNKLYTLYPDLSHPYIEFSEQFGSDAKSHIVVTKDYYVYQTTTNATQNQISFKIVPRAGGSSSTFTLVPASMTTGQTTVVSVKSDTNGNIVEIGYRIQESGAGTNEVCWFDASDPSAIKQISDFPNSNTSDTYQPHMITQQTSTTNTFFWVYMVQYDQTDSTWCWVIRRYSKSGTTFNQADESNRLWGVGYNYNVNRVICDDTYIYVFTDSYQSQDTANPNTGDYTYKVFRYPKNNLTTRLALRVFKISGSTESAWNTPSTWFPLWIDDGVIYLRIKYTSNNNNFLYAATIDDTEGVRTITYKLLNSTPLNNTNNTNVENYMGHLDSTNVLMTGVTGSGSSERARFLIVTITSTSATYGGTGKYGASTLIPDENQQLSPETSTAQRTKHILPTSPFIPAGKCGSIKVSGSTYSFTPIYEAQSSWGVWNSCSVYSVGDILIVSSPTHFTALRTSAEKSDIRYLPGYFREGWTTASAFA